MRFDGKVAFVTGGNRGIGASICKRLASEGADIAFIDRAPDPQEEVIKAVNNFGKRAVFYEADVTDKAMIEEVVANVVKELGSLDILVNNAGITRDNLLIRMKEEDWRAVIDINLTGVFNVTQAVAKIMLKQRSGSIINIASVIGISGNAGQVNYAASKAGVIGVTKSLAKEFANRGVRVNAVAPGFIETAMTKALSEDVREKARQLIPLGFFGEPEDVAAAVSFLASEDARYITGQVLVVDGGMIR
ncbi:MAG: 3-oxoacyl-[acyl-carrier-protein] reductase [Actinomycetota bacterium]|nr:3-oxoacyl-[acyl-carrier-protein] reductase [Actinomycetota bacterium]